MKDTNSLYLSIDEEDIETGLCILDLLGFNDENKTEPLCINFNRIKSRLTVYQNPSADKQTYCLPLYHSVRCPARRYTQELGNNLTIPKLIKVSACVAIESTDNKILLARKTEILDLFPKYWGFPGGKTNHRENPKDCAIREAISQTGIPFKISPDGVWYSNQLVEIEPILLYENLYPNDLNIGLMRAQHVTMFFRAKIPVASHEIALNLQQNEIDFAVWLAKDEYDDIKMDYNGTLEGLLRSRRSMQINYSQLAGVAPNSIGEGISEGHKIALDIIFSAQ
ncbi:unnamed protein product [Blepharisma stoltei]|uniref:Nudix hydrolase domain-containing protein n=1 Tax=Blepharisma stoltei TaxID=1481888 RepID=A0AAU9IDU0_9CILI|nr:unnamed protein product [Blepharisma stoltei]